jgi:hypothetical protein
MLLVLLKPVLTAMWDEPDVAAALMSAVLKAWLNWVVLLAMTGLAVLETETAALLMKFVASVLVVVNCVAETSLYP